MQHRLIPEDVESNPATNQEQTKVEQFNSAFRLSARANPRVWPISLCSTTNCAAYRAELLSSCPFLAEASDSYVEPVVALTIERTLLSVQNRAILTPRLFLEGDHMSDQEVKSISEEPPF